MCKTSRGLSIKEQISTKRPIAIEKIEESLERLNQKMEVMTSRFRKVVMFVTAASPDASLRCYDVLLSMPFFHLRKTANDDSGAWTGNGPRKFLNQQLVPAQLEARILTSLLLWVTSKKSGRAGKAYFFVDPKRGVEMSKIIAVHSYKGGTGKTLLSVNLAELLPSSAKKFAFLTLTSAGSLRHPLAQGTQYWFNDYLNNTADIGQKLKSRAHRKRQTLRISANPAT